MRTIQNNDLYSTLSLSDPWFISSQSFFSSPMVFERKKQKCKTHCLSLVPPWHFLHPFEKRKISMMSSIKLYTIGVSFEV